MRRAGVVALNTSREAGVAIRIPAREIRRSGADTGREHGSDGPGAAAGDALCEAFAGEKRHRGAGGGVFHTAEAGADRRAGAAVFLLHDAVAGNIVHRGPVYRRLVRTGAEEFTNRSDEPANIGLHEMALLPASEF